MTLRPAMYLDLDDTLLSWADGRPRAVPGAGGFLLWALQHYEVRWLTLWCPSGEMKEPLRRDLCRMLGVDVEVTRRIRGLDWQGSDSKLNGIAWVEHLVLGRPFVWVEDEKGVGERERAVLAEHGLLHCYHHVDVTRNPASLLRVRERLALGAAVPPGPSPSADPEPAGRGVRPARAPCSSAGARSPLAGFPNTASPAIIGA